MEGYVCPSGSQTRAIVSFTVCGRLCVRYEKGAHSIEPVNGVLNEASDVSAVDLPQSAIYYLCSPMPFIRALRPARFAPGAWRRTRRHPL
jgi:hypothetical protein